MRFADSITRFPPVTKVSLFASATSFLALIAARVGLNPIMPTTEFKTMSVLSMHATSHKPSIPVTISISILDNFLFNSSNLVSSKIHTFFG